MSSYIDQKDAKIVGRYAVYWMHISERYRSHINFLRLRRMNASQLLNASSSEIPLEERKKETKSPTKKLEQIVQESEDILAKASSVFPFAPFRTTICLDRHKLTITTHPFLKTDQLVSVPIENVKNVQANLGPLFGSLVITSDHFVNNTQEVTYLWRKDAEKIQKIIQGAIVAMSEEVDISKVSPGSLKKHLFQLGQGINN